MSLSCQGGECPGFAGDKFAEENNNQWCIYARSTLYIM